MRLTKTVLATSAAAVLTLGVVVGQAMAYQEHMHAALDALRTARSELQAAEHNKGGHRERAIQLVNDAIDQVQEGIDDGHM
jgi:low affinity Fe/Cu permease